MLLMANFSLERLRWIRAEKDSFGIADEPFSSLYSTHSADAEYGWDMTKRLKRNVDLMNFLLHEGDKAVQVRLRKRIVTKGHQLFLA